MQAHIAEDHMACDQTNVGFRLLCVPMYAIGLLSFLNSYMCDVMAYGAYGTCGGVSGVAIEQANTGDDTCELWGV